MKILKSGGGLKVCFSAKEIAVLLVSRFFNKLFSEKSLKDEPYDSVVISDYVKKLAKDSVDSKDYELFASIMDLYYQFEKDCEFCFNLKQSYDPTKDKILNVDDLRKHTDDPPDVIVLYKGNYYEFELKRYRGELTYEALYSFIKKKIILHYSGKANYLVILQPRAFSTISPEIFSKLHKSLVIEKNQPGHIGLTLNVNNKEIYLIRVLPKLEQSKRNYDTEADIFSEILNS